MSSPIAVDIYDAVCLNSVELLRAYLREGIDLTNLDIGSCVPRFDNVTARDDDGRRAGVREGCFISRTNAGETPVINALHLAIIYCFHEYEATAGRDRSRLDMIRFLLSAGISPKSKCKDFCLRNIRLEGCAANILQMGGEINAISLAELLLLRRVVHHSCEVQRETMKKVKDILEFPARVGNTPFPTSRLLLSDKLSDVTFVCSDDDTTVELLAHKCILASSSDYFDTYFDGPCGEQHPDGKWTTEFPSTAIKAMLTFVYTGQLSFDDTDSDETLAQSVMKLSHEWSLPELFRLAEAKCALSVSLETLPAMMTEAQLYDAKLLKHRCAKFMKENFTRVVLVHPHLTSILASNYPELWSELSALEPQSKRRHTP